jgi:hypothetical protein
MFNHDVARSHHKVPALAVIEIGQDDEITSGADSPCHIMEFFSLTGSVHQKKDNGVRATFLWVGDEGVHLAIGGFDV